jgi:hypothetical protein
VHFLAVFAAVPRGLVLNLTAAIGARVVNHLVIGEDALHGTRDLVKLGLLLLGLLSVGPAA